MARIPQVTGFTDSLRSEARVALDPGSGGRQCGEGQMSPRLPLSEGGQAAKRSLRNGLRAPILRR